MYVSIAINLGSVSMAINISRGVISSAIMAANVAAIWQWQRRINVGSVAISVSDLGAQHQRAIVSASISVSSGNVCP